MPSLKIDLDALDKSHIITHEQKLAIVEWQKKTKEQGSASGFLQILAGFGAVVTGLGVMLLVAANWDGFSSFSKMILLIVATMITYAFGYWFTYKNLSFPKTGQGLLLLGVLLYGASIFLLGQIYHIGGTFSQAFLLWCIGVFPLAYATGFVTLFILSLGLLYFSIFSELGEKGNLSGFTFVNTLIVLGFFLLALARWHKKLSSPHFSDVLLWVGASSILGGVLAYTFLEFWQTGSTFGGGKRVFPTMLYGFLLFGALLSICIDIFQKKSFSPSRDLPFFFGFFVIITLLVVTFLKGQGSSPLAHLDPMVPTVIMSIVYLGVIAVMIWSAIGSENRSLLNVSVLFLAFYLFGKYLAFAFDSKIDGALVFLGGGIACIVMTILVEKIRKRLLRNIHH